MRNHEFNNLRSLLQPLLLVVILSISEGNCSILWDLYERRKAKASRNPVKLEKYRYFVGFMGLVTTPCSQCSPQIAL